MREREKEEIFFQNRDVAGSRNESRLWFQYYREKSVMFAQSIGSAAS